VLKQGLANNLSQTLILVRRSRIGVVRGGREVLAVLVYSACLSKLLLSKFLQAINFVLVADFVHLSVEE
jgi:hypothetical protein